MNTMSFGRMWLWHVGPSPACWGLTLYVRRDTEPPLGNRMDFSRIVSVWYIMFCEQRESLYSCFCCSAKKVRIKLIERTHYWFYYIHVANRCSRYIFFLYFVVFFISFVFYIQILILHVLVLSAFFMFLSFVLSFMYTFPFSVRE